MSLFERTEVTLPPLSNARKARTIARAQQILDRMDDAREATAAASGKKTLPDALDVVVQSASSPLVKNLLQTKRTTRRSASALGESGDEGVAPDDCNTGDQGRMNTSVDVNEVSATVSAIATGAAMVSVAHDSIESQNEPVIVPGDDTTTAVEERDQARGDKMRSTAVVEVMHNGGSATAAAARFGLQRSEVTRILKHAADSVEVSAASSTMTTTAVDASDSETTEDDGKHATIRASVSESAEPQVGKKRKATADANDQDSYASSDASMTTAADANLLTPVKVTSAESLLHASHATDSSGSSSKAKRVRKSKEEKLAILHFVEQGGTHVAAAERFGISRTAVTKMVKEREAIWTKATRTASDAAGEAVTSVTSSTTTTTTLTTTPAETMTESVPPTSLGIQQGLFPASEDAKMALAGTTTTNSVSVDAETPLAMNHSVVPTKANGVGLLPTNASAAAATTAANRKGRRVRKTNVEKLEILAFVEQGGSQGAAAEKFGVSRTAVTKMVKEKEAISAQAHSETTNHRKVLQYQHKLSIIEDMLYKWQVQVEFEAPTLKVTGDLLQSKAMEFRNKILAEFSSDLPDEVVVSLTDFKASNGWLHRYTQRRNVRSLSKSEHHSISTDPSYVEKRMERIRNQLTLLHVPLHCIWNMDEAVIRHRTTSSRVDATINLDPRSHEKMIVTFCTSAAGEKLTLQVVGGNNEPSSLKDVDPLLALGVHYHAQRKACQDSSTVMHFVNLMNHEARSRKQIWYVLLDNCPSHMAAATILDPNGSYDTGFKVDSLVLIVLPPNSVSSLQPLQLGIIRSFKYAFRREMLHTIISEYAVWESLQQHGDKETTATTTATTPTMPLFGVHAFTHARNALLWLHGAWNSTSATAIRQAWAKSNYLPTHLLPELSDDLAQPLDTTIYGELLELLTTLSTKKDLAAKLGLDNVGDTEQVATELINLDEPETSGSDDVNDDEIVMESLSAQGLIRDSHRLQGGVLGDAIPDIASISDACGTVEKLLRFMDKANYEQLPATDRRMGRNNLLVLHRILLKARAKERSSTAYTV